MPFSHSGKILLFVFLKAVGRQLFLTDFFVPETTREAEQDWSQQEPRTYSRPQVVTKTACCCPVPI